jgi:cell division protein FtsB
MQKNLFFLGLLLGLTVLAQPVSAQTLRQQREVTKTQIQELRAERSDLIEENKELRDAAIAERCAVLTERVSTRVQRFNTHRQSMLKWSQNMVALAESAIDKAEAVDLSTSEVTSALSNFKAKIASTEVLYDDYLTSLKETQAKTCGESDGEFKTELLESRAAFLKVRNSLLELKRMYQTELRPALQKLRQQAAQANRAEQ